MKGLFIPDITAETLRNVSLEAVEALMAEGEFYDIEYEPECEVSEMEEASVLHLAETHLTETLRKELNDAYRLGFEDAWNYAKELWKDGTISFEWSSTEMYQYAKKKWEYSKEVEELAEKMGIHALYAEVVALRGEGE